MVSSAEGRALAESAGGSGAGARGRTGGLEIVLRSAGRRGGGRGAADGRRRSERAAADLGVVGVDQLVLEDDSLLDGKTVDAVRLGDVLVDVLLGASSSTEQILSNSSST